MSAVPNSSSSKSKQASKQLNRILQDQQLKHQQIACINLLQQGLQRPQSSVSQSVAAYSYLLDGEPLQCIASTHLLRGAAQAKVRLPLTDPTVHTEVLLNIALEVQRDVLANGVRCLPTQHARHAASICRVLLSAFGICLQGAVNTSEQDMEVQLPNFVPQPVSGCTFCGDSFMFCGTVLCLQPLINSNYLPI